MHLIQINMNNIEITSIEKIPEDITVGYLQVVIMPNGEVICEGKSLGFFKKLGKYLFKENNAN